MWWPECSEEHRIPTQINHWEWSNSSVSSKRIKTHYPLYLLSATKNLTRCFKNALDFSFYAAHKQIRRPTLCNKSRFSQIFLIEGPSEMGVILTFTNLIHPGFDLRLFDIHSYSTDPDTESRMIKEACPVSTPALLDFEVWTPLSLVNQSSLEATSSWWFVLGIYDWKLPMIGNT